MGIYELHMRDQEDSAKMIVQQQARMLQRLGERERMNARSLGGNYVPEHRDSPDAKGIEDTFVVTVGGYDIYIDEREAHLRYGGGCTFIMIRSNEPGDYVTTNFPITYVRGFFESYLQ